ncbi:MAG: hypothetical protein MI754_15065 [Chromatiales bacterium]|nr:hypothetical protein [Chromatiales bacterium]
MKKEHQLGAISCSISALYLLPTVSAEAAVTNGGAIGYNLGGTPVFWDVDSDGSNDFRLHGFQSTYTTGTVTSMYGGAFLDSGTGFSPLRDEQKKPVKAFPAPNPLNGRGMVQASPERPGRPQKLSDGFMVGPSLASGYSWGASGLQYRVVVYSTSGSGDVGNDMQNGGFVGGGSEYFGFRFESNGQTHYGWAEIDINASTAPFGFTITRWAYEDTPDTPIAVGAVAPTAPSSQPVSVPVGGAPMIGLTMLGLGAAGLRELRRRRKSKAVH